MRAAAFYLCLLCLGCTNEVCAPIQCLPSLRLEYAAGGFEGVESLRVVWDDGTLDCLANDGEWECSPAGAILEGGVIALDETPDSLEVVLSSASASKSFVIEPDYRTSCDGCKTSTESFGE